MAAPALSIYRFFTKYEKDPTDPAKLRAVDWISYGPIGQERFNVTDARVRDIIDRLVPNSGSQSPSSIAANARADYIRPRYEAWKAGREAPTDGTPLAAWNALTPEQADIFRTNGFKTVEAIAAMTDQHITRIPLPGLREIVRQAGMFIDSAEQTRFAARLTEKDEEVAALKAENAESKAQIAALMEKIDQLAEMVVTNGEAAASGPEEVKRGPGRPRKAEAA